MEGERVPRLRMSFCWVSEGGVVMLNSCCVVREKVRENKRVERIFSG